MKKHILFFVIGISLSFSCSNDDPENSMMVEESVPEEGMVGETNYEEEEIEETTTDPNILLIIADDMGLDATPGYGIGTEKPIMNTLQGFMEKGIRFTNLWSNPTCTPTRSTILTGKYGFRTNMLKVGDVLSTSEISLQSYIDSQTESKYSQAVIGKWHLSSDESHPRQMEVPYYAGLLRGTPRAYDNWNFTENENTSVSNEYNTTKYTDLAIDWIDEQTKPWFLWLAYTAPHSPFHLPPSNLHTQNELSNDQASIDENPLPYYLAMLESLDTEMGRLLSTIPEETLENTVIIFIGDNGTPNEVAQEYMNRRTKNTVFQGGVNVPMIVTGKNVDRINEVEDALVNTTDLFATIAELAGTSTSSINDSVSFKNLFSSTQTIREYAYTEIGDDNGGSDYTIRNSTHKYIVFNNGEEALYNLIQDPMENDNLLENNLSSEDGLERDKLVAELINLRGE